MSKVAELAYDIEQLYIDGLSAEDIADELSCPVEMVQDAIDEIECVAVQDRGQRVFDHLVREIGQFSPHVTVNS
jgi:hypothetical protein